MMKFLAGKSGEYGLGRLLGEDKTSSLLTGESDLIGSPKRQPLSGARSWRRQPFELWGLERELADPAGMLSALDALKLPRRVWGLHA